MEIAVNSMQEVELKMMCKVLENNSSSCYSRWYLLYSLVQIGFVISVGTWTTLMNTVSIGKHYCSYSNISTVFLVVMSKLTPDHIIRSWKVLLSGLWRKK